MKVGHCDVQPQYSRARSNGFMNSLPSVFISKRLQRQRMSRTVLEPRRGSSLWIYYLFLLWKMARIFNARLLWTWADREQKTKEHFQMSLGEWVSLTSLARLSFCFPLFLSLSHLALWVLTLCLSGVLLLLCPHTYPPLKPTIISLSLLFVSLSLPLFLTFSPSLTPPPPTVPLSLCPSLETCARYSCVNDGKSMWQCPATTNTHPCQLMTLRGIPRCPSPWLPGWVPAESAVKSCTLAALPVQGTVEVTSVTVDDTVLAASASHALSLSSISTVYAVWGSEVWEIWAINWLYLQCSQSSREWRGKNVWEEKRNLSWSVNL